MGEGDSTGRSAVAGPRPARDAGGVAGSRQTWLGWPLWLVSALLVVSAVTGSAGPIEVIWLLGTISVAVSIAWVHLRGWTGGARSTDDRSLSASPPQQPAAQGSPPAGTDAVPDPAGHRAGTGNAASAGG